MTLPATNGDKEAEASVSAKETKEKNEKPNNSDFVIREGFPALRLPDPQVGPWIEGEEPLPAREFWAEKDSLDFQSESLLSLQEDCRAVFTARSREQGESYSAGVTYFLPVVMKPRCALEGLVQEIFRQHTKNLEPGVMVPESSGAEWWTLVLDEEENENTGDDDSEDEGDEVGLHFDADYGLEDQAPNLFLHPRLATVTYMTSYGVPTVVLNRRSPPPNDVNKESLNGPVDRGWISHPQLGKHMAFDGRLLHGAPATFFPQRSLTSPDNPPLKKAKSTKTRITLLVNIWINHCPLDAEPLDDDMCQSLTCPWESESGKSDPDYKQPFVWTGDTTGTGDKPISVKLEADSDDPAGEEEVVIGNRLVTAYYNPNMKALHEACEKGDLVELDMNGSVLLKVGDEVSSDSEDDNE